MKKLHVLTFAITAGNRTEEVSRLYTGTLSESRRDKINGDAEDGTWVLKGEALKNSELRNPEDYTLISAETLEYSPNVGEFEKEVTGGVVARIRSEQIADFGPFIARVHKASATHATVLLAVHGNVTEALDDFRYVK